MKKNFEKLITISLAVISSIFVIFLLVLIGSTKAATEANNSVVHALFAVFTIIFILLSTINIRESFSTDEKVNQILLFKSQNSTKKASVGLIRKLARQAVATVDMTKIRSINLFVDDNGEVVMKANIRIITPKDNQEPIKAVEILEKVNAALEDQFQEILGFAFKEIELKLVSAKIYRKTDVSKIEEKLEVEVKESKTESIEESVIEEQIVEDNQEIDESEEVANDESTAEEVHA